jgi:hypothetical protein
MEGMDFTGRSFDELEQFVTGIERGIARSRAAQMAALREVDRRQGPLADGCRSLVEWVTGRLDVLPDTAKVLVSTARRLEELPLVEAAALAGRSPLTGPLRWPASPLRVTKRPSWQTPPGWMSPGSTARSPPGAG